MKWRHGTSALAALMIAAGLSAEPKLRNTVVIPLTLPKNYMPAYMPDKPLDSELRVCLALPVYDVNASATWPVAVKWTGGLTPRPDEITEIDRVILNFADPVAGALPAIFKRLFPRTEIASRGATCDLKIGVVVSSRAFDLANDQLGGVTLHAIVTAVDADGNTVAEVNAGGTGRVTKSIYWSEQTRARSLGEPAMHEMLEHLVRNLEIQSSLLAFLKTKSTERARPSDLETTARFDDSKSFLPNGRLDAGEHALLHLQVTNHGAGPGFGVKVRITSPATAIKVLGDLDVGDILPGQSKDVVSLISGALEVSSAVQTLRIETLEKRGYGGRPLLLQLTTAELQKPSLDIADISLNGRPSNGESVEAKVLVRNAGPGIATGVHLSIASAAGIEVTGSTALIPSIPVNGVAEAHASVRLPITFAGGELPITVQGDELRGATVAHVERTATWPVELKHPGIEVGYRVYDGNSPESRGNRDGVANNGEVLEIALTPTNRGTLTARDVEIAIKPRQAGVTIDHQTFKAGDLPPLAEGLPHRVRVTLPRAFGTDQPIEKLPFVVTVAQRDFAPSEQSLAIPFRGRRPAVTATLAAAVPLVEGKPAQLVVDVRNQGDLVAENVTVDVTCDNAALELLDEDGAPVGKRVVKAGTVAPEAPFSATIRAQVRRNLSQQMVRCSATARQTDFASAQGEPVALNIQREDAVVVTAAPIAPPIRPAVAPATGMETATVSFQEPENGQRVSTDTIDLRFEVQSRTPLKSVRVEQNQRAVDAGAARVLDTGNGQAWQYAPHVRLDYGENLFEVVVVTAEGAPTKRRVMVNRERPNGRIWVAAVGISKYANKAVSDLAFARDDADSIISYYRDLGVPETQLIRLVDDQATLSNIKRTLGTELVNKATNPEDTVILYFAGHGQKEADRASGDADGYTKYLLAYDANPTDPFTTALSMDEISRVLQRLAPDRVVLIIDSCFSGAAGGRTLSNGDMTARAAMTDEFLARLVGAGRGRIILTASSGQEVARESPRLRHGVFTSYLLEGLAGAADADHDGRIDVDEIYKYVAQKVSDATNGSQTPMKKGNVTGTVVIGGRLRAPQ